MSQTHSIGTGLETGGAGQRLSKGAMSPRGAGSVAGRLPGLVAGLVAAAAGLGTPAIAAEPNVVTFASGTNEGWSVAGRTTVGSVGNPAPALNVVLDEVFGADIRDDAGDPRWKGDYRALGTFTLSVDVKVDSIDFFGTQVSRDLIVELRDTTNPPDPYPWVSVWARLGTLSSSQPGWRTYTITVVDPNQASLPAGWGGYGAETPFGDPILPADRTFASVLASVDEVVFSTYVPGFFYGFTNFDIQVDNIRLAANPPCYANCDGSTVAPVLNAGDFSCFLGGFRAAGSLPASQQVTSAANCDGSTVPPVLNAGDFSCFLARFRAGCP